MVFPRGIASDARGGRLFVTDRANERVQVYRRDGTWLRSIGGPYGSAVGQFNCPWAVCYDAPRDELFVTDSLNNRVQVFDATSGARIETSPTLLAAE